jgi:hypothetical protein
MGSANTLQWRMPIMHPWKLLAVNWGMRLSGRVLGISLLIAVSRRRVEPVLWARCVRRHHRSLRVLQLAPSGILHRSNLQGLQLNVPLRPMQYSLSHSRHRFVTLRVQWTRIVLGWYLHVRCGGREIHHPCLRGRV